MYSKFGHNMDLQTNEEKARCEDVLANIKMTPDGS